MSETPEPVVAGRIGITGSAGIIGSRLAADLERDCDIVRIGQAMADVLDPAALRRAFRGCETIVHLAGGVLRDGSWNEVWDANLLGARNVFEAAVATGCRRVIYAGSLHVLGMYEEEGRPAIYAPGNAEYLGTGLPPRPANPYGVTKACGEIIARYYSDVHGLQVTCVRIGTMNVADSPVINDVAADVRLSALPGDERRARLAAKWFSHADFARLVRAIVRRDVRFCIIYGVGDNPGRFVDLEPGRALFGFWPLDGSES
jgi:NAD(P)-dependent dehydrogenase (short-subunit alcohol dehydrogenase family)